MIMADWEWEVVSSQLKLVCMIMNSRRPKMKNVKAPLILTSSTTRLAR
jgi:hypothetical protein